MKSIKSLTRNRLLNQTLVPLSPGRMDDKNPQLCLGAALVASHLELTRGPRAAAAFAERIVKEPSSQAILETAASCGFPLELCRHAIGFNDSLGDSERQSATVEHLDELPC